MGSIYRTIHRYTMTLHTVLLCLAILGSTVVSTRDTSQCAENIERFNECAKKAYENFMKVFRQGDDGKRPDWLARKSCNYLTESVETCGNKQVGVCFTQEEIDKKKDEQLKIALEQVRTNIPAWDSNKCPAIKAHLLLLLLLLMMLLPVLHLSKSPSFPSLLLKFILSDIHEKYYLTRCIHQCVQFVALAKGRSH